jgi:hypothetical protein
MEERKLAVSEFCEKFNKWAQLRGESDEQFREAWEYIYRYR